MNDENPAKEKDGTSLNTLLSELNDENSNRRIEATKRLGELRDPRAVEALITAYKNVRKSPGCAGEYHVIALSLGQIGGTQAVEALIEFLQYENPHTGYKNPVIRKYAAIGLGETRDPQAIDSLLAVMDEYEPDVPYAAAQALGRIGNERATEALFTFLQSESAGMRKRGIIGLRELKESRFVEPIIAALQDQDDEVRVLAASELGHIGDQRAIPALVNALQDEFWSYVGEDKYYGVREAAKNALKEIGEPATNFLITLLQSEDKNQRLVAEQTLGKLGDMRAVEPLTVALNDPDSSVRLGAENSLKKLSPI